MTSHMFPVDNDGMYHIYNRAVGNEQLFITHKHYLHFLKGIEKYLLPHVEVWSYCLMPNHFHLLIELKKDTTGEVISKALGDCCNAYTKWLNILTNRKGNLFIRPFKRNKINSEADIAATIWYIHRNPLHHNYVKHLEEWRFSSYKACTSTNTKVSSKKVLKLFGGVNEYIKFHQKQLEEDIVLVK